MAQELGVSVPEADLEFGWTEKLNMALDAGAAVLWSMFGTFTEEEITCIHAAGAEAWTTVTTPAEAVEAARRGVDALCVQGPEAGGHRGVWDAEAEPDWRPLEELVFAVHAALGDAPIPLIAAGGMRSSADVERALAWPGVVAVSCGSAFLWRRKQVLRRLTVSFLRVAGGAFLRVPFPGVMRVDWKRNLREAIRSFLRFTPISIRC